jgi:hypothetical protein
VCKIEEQERFHAAPACGRQARNEDNFFATLKVAVVGIKLQHKTADVPF